MKFLTSLILLPQKKFIIQVNNKLFTTTIWEAFMKKVLKSNIYFLIILLLEIILPLPLSLIYRILNITDIRIILLLNHTIIFIIPAIIYLLVTKQSAKKVLRLNKLYFKDSLLLILLAFMCQPIMMFFSLISQFFFENDIGNFLMSISDTPYIVMLLLIAIMPAITEEITLRGIVLSGYDNKNMYISCAIIGLLFGIFHLDYQQFLYAAVLGFILALVVRITNSIFAGSLIHFVINGTSITLQKLMTFNSNNTEIVDQATEISLKALPLEMKLITAGVYGVIAIAFSISVYYIIKKLKKLNIERGTLREEGHNRNKYYDSNDKIFNIVFFIIIIVYLSYMFLLPYIIFLINSKV